MYLHFKRRRGVRIGAESGGLLRLQGPDLAFLWRHVRRHRRQIGVVLLLSLPLAALGGLLAWVGKNVTESVSQQFDPGTVLFWIGVALLGTMVASAFEIASGVIMTTLHARVSHRIRLELYDSIQHGPIDFHLHHRSGELANLIANDAQAAAAGSIELVAVLWQCPLRILFLLGVMVYFNWQLSVLALLTAPLLARAVLTVSRRARRHELEYLEHQGQMLGMMVESVTNVRQVKSFGLESHTRQRFEQEGEILIQARRMAALVKSLVSPASELILGLLLVAMVLVAYYQVTNGHSTTAAITACLIAALGIKKPIKDLSRAIVELQRSFAAIGRIRWITGIAAEKNRVLKVPTPLQSIRLRDVAFSYDGQRSILRGVNLELRAGEHIAVTGPSGAGKTTFSDLISGFYPCSSGDIRIDGHRLADIDVADWRTKIGIVSQEPFLFDASIRENVRLGNLEAEEEQIVAALEAAGCTEMMARLPGGLDAAVGERGVLLSGGERKRVALARVFVRNVAVLILDEATSELDSASELHILDTIRRWKLKPIVINISHRPSILGHCDRVLRVENGAIEEVPADAVRADDAPTRLRAKP